jgi:hypothetical protein
MKRFVLTLIISAALFHCFAQKEKKEEEKEKFFTKYKLFAGGGTTVSIFYGTTLGIAPHLGYSLTNWADVAINLDYNYQAQRDYFDYGDKIRQTIIAPGGFIRLFPVNFLFAQVQYQHNFIRLRYIPENNSGDEIYHFNSNSVLVGAGYTGGRDGYDDEGYYYFSVMFDVLGSQNSPYIDNRGRKIPIIKAGYSIRLFQKPKHRKRK